MNELDNLKEHIRQDEENLEAVQKNIVEPIKQRIEAKKQKVHELLTNSL